jgi:hypothetical protein
VNPLAGVLSEAWATYRAHARHLITIALAIYLVAAIIEAVLGLLGVLGAILAAIVGIIAGFVLQATLVKAVEDVRDGRADLSLQETVQAARPTIGRVALASILAGIGIVIGLLLLIVPGLFLITIWCMIVPVIVLEGAGVGDAFERSRQLVRGHGMQVFGTLVLVFLLLIAASLVLSLVFSPLPDAVGTFLSSLVSGAFVSPYLAVVLTLGYFRLRAVESPAPDGYGAGPAPTV